MKYLISGLIVALILLHQDYWQWNNGTLDFGFVPRALTYHAGLSVLAAITWAMAVRWCWPREVDLSQPSASEEAAP
jgi:hypothetical protein